MHRQYLGGGVRVLVTQAEVIYVDEVNRLCCPQQQQQPSTSNAADGAAASSSSAGAAAGGLMAAAVMEKVASGGGGNNKEEASSFFDPLLHRPPEVVEADRKAQARREQGMLNRPWIAGEGVVILVPLRLGLASLNGDYIPGACLGLSGKGCWGGLVLVALASKRLTITATPPYNYFRIARRAADPALAGLRWGQAQPRHLLRREPVRAPKHNVYQCTNTHPFL